MLISVSGSLALQQAARDLKKAGDPAMVRRELRTGITKAVRPMLRAVQKNVRDIPAHGRRHTGLRGDIARATRMRTVLSGQAAVILEVAPSRMPAGKGSLAALMDGQGRWRHPVFGNTGRWANQRAHPYFWRSVQPYLGDARQAVIDAIDRATAHI